MEYKEFKASFDELLKDYFNKYFAGQSDINTVILQRIESCMKSLLKTQSEFLFLLESLKQVKNDERFYKTCSSNKKESIDTFIICIEYITTEFEEILSGYLDGIKD